jgi:hypothetical protein
MLVHDGILNVQLARLDNGTPPVQYVSSLNNKIQIIVA